MQEKTLRFSLHCWCLSPALSDIWKNNMKNELLEAHFFFLFSNLLSYPHFIFTFIIQQCAKVWRPKGKVRILTLIMSLIVLLKLLFYEVIHVDFLGVFSHRLTWTLFWILLGGWRENVPSNILQSLRKSSRKCPWLQCLSVSVQPLLLPSFLVLSLNVHLFSPSISCWLSSNTLSINRYLLQF